MDVDQFGLDVLAAFGESGDSMSNRSRDIRLHYSVTNDNDDEASIRRSSHTYEDRSPLPKNDYKKIRTKIK